MIRRHVDLTTANRDVLSTTFPNVMQLFPADSTNALSAAAATKSRRRSGGYAAAERKLKRRSVMLASPLLREGRHYLWLPHPKPDHVDGYHQDHAKDNLLDLGVAHVFTGGLIVFGVMIANRRVSVPGIFAAKEANQKETYTVVETDDEINSRQSQNAGHAREFCGFQQGTDILLDIGGSPAAVVVVVGVVGSVLFVLFESRLGP